MVGVIFAADSEPPATEQIKVLLLQALVPDIHPDESVIFTGEASIRFAVLDTPLMVISSWNFSYNPQKLWEAETPSIRKISVFSPNDAKWFPTDAIDAFSEETLDEIAQLLIYPYSILAKRFKGYTINSQKKRIELGNDRCLKISVKPVFEDNDEDSPFFGHFYIADDKDHRIVRMEHSKESANTVTMVRWDFKHIENLNCDFPYRMTISVESEMCNFEFNTQVKVYFVELSAEKFFQVENIDDKSEKEKPE